MNLPICSAISSRSGQDKAADGPGAGESPKGGPKGGDLPNADVGGAPSAREERWSWQLVALSAASRR
jgi:hypothetical protein